MFKPLGKSYRATRLTGPMIGIEVLFCMQMPRSAFAHATACSTLKEVIDEYMSALMKAREDSTSIGIAGSELHLAVSWSQGCLPV